MAPHKDDPEVMARMQRWLTAVSHELGVNTDLIEENQKPLLDLISAVAHGPSRPGAPLTAFLVGYAAASTDTAPKELAARLQQLAENFG
ncbi:MAG: DUF6457 domain-containing protein [Arcanobacterium sp.]|nr:DUF6457 domain-containing protein [Arcanobacterium sp.]